MIKQLYIIGAGGVGGHLALNIRSYIDEFEVAGFFDDDPSKIGSNYFGYKVLGSVKDALVLKDANIAVGISKPEIKKRIIDILTSNKSLSFPTLVHGRAWVSENVNIGKGTVIYPGTSINYGCSIDDFVVINMNCALGHHTSIGHFSSLSPGVNTGGYTDIKSSVEMGIGSSTLQNVTIHNNSIIGGQAMVIESIPENCIAVGIPAKILSK